ncbi:GIY-YIG nuclease family protein [Mucilaginibacter auburnensis]|uniref:GIY-YIG catalytic domain-containing protein n=1 Tax=Mucilaginibacter auburnensis TaxID=1457233 RepID=A0A2H9VSK1_9SPHI|nr:GIY-YIG nuclease family protein [Mucilaginibacter auburnensis]PJJ83801.1 GIY-YIG catalytic domain-containing protein [Mucilaginibacter auburnensis]
MLYSCGSTVIALSVVLLSLSKHRQQYTITFLWVYATYLHRGPYHGSTELTMTSVIALSVVMLSLSKHRQRHVMIVYGFMLHTCIGVRIMVRHAHHDISLYFHTELVQTHKLYISYYMKTYFVYILLCSDESYYTGVTNNIDIRFSQHAEGINPTCYTYKKATAETGVLRNVY